MLHGIGLLLKHGVDYVLGRRLPSRPALLRPAAPRWRAGRSNCWSSSTTAFPARGVKDTIFCIEALEKAGLRSFHISESGEYWGFMREHRKVTE